MKKLKWIWVFIALSMLSFFVVLIESFVMPLPDWIVRGVGIITILSLFVVMYKIAKLRRDETK